MGKSTGLMMAKVQRQGRLIDWPTDDVIYNKWQKLNYGNMAELGKAFGVSGNTMGQRMSGILERRKLNNK